MMTALLACFAAILAAVPAPAPSLTLASRGGTRYAIALAPDATAPEKNAAEELRSYLKQITGADFAITAPAQVGTRPVIAVGPGAARAIAPDLALDAARLGDDGIVWATRGANLVLTGGAGSKRGTLYAVYEFVEKQLGVRWWTPTESTVPHKRTLRIAPIDRVYVPQIAYRDILHTDLQALPEAGGPASAANAARMRFAVRQRVNGHAGWIAPEWGGHYQIIGWCHTFYAWMPPDKYFAAHPEWYSLIGGKRTAENAQLCCTNEEMVAELARNVLAQIRANPDAGYISVSQNDSAGNCQCPKCRAIDEAEGSPSGSLLYCVNKVAEAVEKEYPNFKVETLAYWYTRKPPKTVHPRPNVLIRLAIIERWSAQPVESEQNRQIHEDMKAWAAIAPNLFVWDYIDNMWCLFIAHPNSHIIVPDARTYAQNHVVGVFYEGDDATVSVGEDELRAYLMAHALWDPSVDSEALIGEFLRGYYGKAAPVLRECLRIVAEEGGRVRIGGNGDGTDQAAWLRLDAMNRLTALYDKAEKLVAGDEVLLTRVQRMRSQTDHQWLKGYDRYRALAVTKGEPFRGPKDPVAAAEQFIERAKSYGADRLCWADPSAKFSDEATRLLEAAKRSAAIKVPARAPSLPELLKGKAAGRVVDVQEALFDYPAPEPGAASQVDDAKASNGRAAFVNPAISTWPVQIHNWAEKGATGRCHIYASIRFEPIAKTGLAFVGGVWDTQASRDEAPLVVNIEEAKKPGEYALYDLGVHDVRDALYVWFGTTREVTPQTIEGIYVDRVLFVKE